MTKLWYEQWLFFAFLDTLNKPFQRHPFSALWCHSLPHVQHRKQSLPGDCDTTLSWLTNCLTIIWFGRWVVLNIPSSVSEKLRNKSTSNSIFSTKLLSVYRRLQHDLIFRFPTHLECKRTYKLSNFLCRKSSICLTYPDLTFFFFLSTPSSAWFDSTDELLFAFFLVSTAL